MKELSEEAGQPVVGTISSVAASLLAHRPYPRHPHCSWGELSPPKHLAKDGVDPLEKAEVEQAVPLLWPVGPQVRCLEERKWFSGFSSFGSDCQDWQTWATPIMSLWVCMYFRPRLPMPTSLGVQHCKSDDHASECTLKLLEPGLCLQQCS